MCKSLSTVALLVVLLASCGQGTKKQETEKKDTLATVTPITIEERNQLTEVITRFVRAYISRDNQKVNNLIHPDLGFTVIYRPGAADTFVKVDSMDFWNPVPDYFPYPVMQNDYVLTFEKLPEFDCGTEQWTKLGFFCDTTSHPKQQSNIAAFEKEFDESKLTEEELEVLEKNEEASFRVILTSKMPLIFHVQRYNGNWYVTALDRAYAGCDA